MPGFVYPSDLEPSARWFGRNADVIKLTMSADALITYTFKEYNDSADAPLTLPTAGVRTSLLTAEAGPLVDAATVVAPAT